MTRSETFLGNKNVKALPNVPLGFRLREQVRPGHVDHVGGALLAFRASEHLLNLWQAATQVALCRRARH